MTSETRQHFARPKLHLTPPYGWLNDPCGPGYDPVKQRYHLFYQWNPRSCEWGNISWGHVTSSDLVNWEQECSEPVLLPDTAYDGEGVFTGCFVPTGLRGEEGQLTVIYTSVCHLPIHWTIPYQRASEGIAAATSLDGGKTWIKTDANPLLEEEPEGLHVTGWRDPYISQWPALDSLLGKSSLYGLVSGGIHDDGPAVFLYAVPPNDLANWEYLGPLLRLARNFKFSGKWSGDLGVNLECANIATLCYEPGEPSFNFLVVGSEGGVQRDWIRQYLEDKPETNLQRTIRYCNWLSGTLDKTDDGNVKLSPTFGGIFDHGVLYAVNSFRDPVSQRQIAWGWIPEEDIPLTNCKKKGWNGCLSLPRELFLQRIPNVVGALASPLNEINSVHLEAGSNESTFTLYTLGIRPLPDVSRQRFTNSRTWHNIPLPGENGTEGLKTIGSVNGDTWKLKATINITHSCTELGLHIRHCAGLSTRTTISLQPQDELIVVDRSKTTADPAVNKCDERGPFTLFTLDSGYGQVREKLEIEVFWDGGVLEVFACDRFALSTMVYTTDSEALGVSLFAKGQPRSAVFEKVEISDG